MQTYTCVSWSCNHKVQLQFQNSVTLLLTFLGLSCNSRSSVLQECLYQSCLSMCNECFLFFHTTTKELRTQVRAHVHSWMITLVTRHPECKQKLPEITLRQLRTMQVRFICSASLATIWSRICFLSLNFPTWSGGMRLPARRAAGWGGSEKRGRRRGAISNVHNYDSIQQVQQPQCKQGKLKCSFHDLTTTGNSTPDSGNTLIGQTRLSK